MARFTISGYGQLELNHVAFPKDGRIEAQLPMHENITELENGMLLAVDKVGGCINYATDATLPIALHYSAEHMYDERKRALKDFVLEAGTFYPRLGYLAVGDTFTTNCIAYNETDTDEFTNEAAAVTALGAIATTTLYGGISDEGAIDISATKPTVGPALLVIKKTTMPDGTLGVKFQVLEA